MSDISFSLSGVDSLLKKLASVNHDIKYKGGRSALRKSAKLVETALKANASKIDDPVSVKNISKNVAIRWSSRRFRSTGDLMFRVGILGGASSYADSRENRRKGRAGQQYSTGGDKSNPGGDTWHWRLIEFGTAKMPAQPFARKALADNIAAATNQFISAYEKSLDRAIKRRGSV